MSYPTQPDQPGQYDQPHRQPTQHIPYQPVAYGAPPPLTPPSPPRRKGMHPLAITGIVIGVILALCVVGGIATALLSSEDPETAADDQPQARGEPSALAEPVEEEAEAVPGIGDPARDGKFEFVVTDIETGIDSVGDEFLGKDAQGQFVFVHLAVENIGDESQIFDGSSQFLIDTEGREHSSDGEAAIYVENSESFLNEINPGNQVEGIVVFDIPDDATPATLRLHDSFLSGGVEVTVA
jgi:uncharacterized protein DUF4352